MPSSPSYCYAFCSLLWLSSAHGLLPGSKQVNVIDLGYAKYQGMTDPTTQNTQFLGIRYAAPPTGMLRWAEPQSPPAIQSILQAVDQPNQCFQSTIGQAPLSPFRLDSVTSADPKQLSRRDVPPSSEDCLFLNVYVPGKLGSKKHLPVVVWIYGGGYVMGSASGLLGSGPFDGNDLIKEAGGGIIAVVIQYRLGVLGFLAGDKVKKDGALNVGLLDQQFALKWVQDHIGKFGGEPTKVTIWGESAGAGSVLQHIISNGGKTSPPLFRAAITSSTFLPPQYRYDEKIPEEIYKSTVAQTNCSAADDTFSCLRGVDAAIIQSANLQIANSSFYGTFNPGPVVDGAFITDRPTNLLRRGKFNGEFLLSVTNSHEGNLLVDQTKNSTVEVPEYIAQLFPLFGAREIAAAAARYVDFGSNIDQVNAIMGESIFVCPTYLLLRAFSARAFKGEFAVSPSLHGSDQQYYFPSQSIPIAGPPFLNPDFDNAFSNSFLDFVMNLDPNIKHNTSVITPEWSRWSMDNSVEMLFNKTADGNPDIRTVQTSAKLVERCDFWESVGALSGQ